MKISKALSADVYFAHPYSSWERGLNENTNGLLRQYFPKNTDFKKVTQIVMERAVKQLKESLIKATFVIPSEAWIQQNQYLIDSFLCENNLVQRFLNSHPRKYLGFKTPDQLMEEHRAALAA